MADNESQDPSKEARNNKERQLENSSQTDDDLVLEGHCCNASLELIEINAKLDKLLNAFGEFETTKERVIQLEEEN